jgi:hypothetical protein
MTRTKKDRPKEPYCRHACNVRKLRGGCYKCTHPPKFKGLSFHSVAFMGDL